MINRDKFLLLKGETARGAAPAPRSVRAYTTNYCRVIMFTSEGSLI